MCKSAKDVLSRNPPKGLIKLSFTYNLHTFFFNLSLKLVFYPCEFESIFDFGLSSLMVAQGCPHRLNASKRATLSSVAKIIQTGAYVMQ